MVVAFFARAGEAATEVRELPVLIVDILDEEGRLFSMSLVVALSWALLPAGLRTADETGRVGALLMVLPGVREANVLGFAGADEVIGVRLLTLALDEVVDDFFGSSLEDFSDVGRRFMVMVVVLMLLLFFGSSSYDIVRSV